MGKGDAPTIGYWHKMTLYTGLCHGPVDAFRCREWGGEIAWEGNQTASGTININKPELFGGEKKEGGIRGQLVIRMGEPGQLPHALQTALRTGPWPAARGLLTTVYDGDVSALSPYVKTFRDKISRWNAGWGTAPWQPALCKIGEGCNPAHIIYQVLTNPQWGTGLPTSVVDEATFSAAAQTLFDEGFGLCLTWTNGSAADFMGSVCEHIGGMYADAGGTFELRLFRAGYDVDALPLIDESIIIELQEWNQPLPADSVNEVTVVGVDAATGKDVAATAQNLANIQAQGRVVPKKVELPGLWNKDLVARVATRECQAASMLPFVAKVRVKSGAGPYRRGEVRALSWSRKGIVRAPVRIMDVDEGTATDTSCLLTLLQDVNGMVQATYVQPGDSAWTPPDTTPVPLNPEMVYEATRRDLERVMRPADLALVGDTAGYLVALGARPANVSYNYDLRTRIGTAPFTTRGSGDFTPTGQLQDAIPASDGPTVVVLVNHAGLSGVNVGDECIIESEHCRVDSVDPDTGALTLARGCVDTVPAAHPAMARVWISERYHGIDTTQYLDGETVDAKLCTRTSSGVLADTDAVTRSVVMDSRQARPYAPGRFRVNGAAWPESVISDDLTATWAHRDRLLQADQLVDTAQISIGPEPGVEYTVRWYNQAGTLLSTDAGISGAASGTFAPALTTTVVRCTVEARRAGLGSLQLLDHQFAWAPPPVTIEFDGGAFDPRVTVTRSSTGTRYNAAGALAVVAIDTPRIDYDPATLAVRGLLVEAQSTNLLTHSGIDTGIAGMGNKSNVADATISWLGAFTAGVAFGNNSVTRTAYITNNLNAAGTVYVLSVFVKMDDGLAPNFGSNAGTYDAALVVGGQLAATVTTTAIGGGIYRISASRSHTATNTANGVIKYNSNSARSFVVTGYQLEVGTTATSYIPTTTAAVTRAADNVEILTSDLRLNAAAGGFYAEYMLPYASRSGTFGLLVFGSNNAPAYYSNSTAPRIHDSTTSLSAAAGATPFTTVKMASSWGPSGLKIKATGGTLQTAGFDGSMTSDGSPARIGRYNYSTTSQQLNGWIRRLSLWRTELSAAEIEGMVP